MNASTSLTRQTALHLLAKSNHHKIKYATHRQPLKRRLLSTAARLDALQLVPDAAATGMALLTHMQEQGVCVGVGFAFGGFWV